MLIGVVSDTHSHVEYTQDAVRILTDRGAEMVLHCGDIGSVSIVRCFPELPAHFVLGNVDTNRDEVQEAVRQAGHTFHGRVGHVDAAGKRIVFLHGDDSRRLCQSIASEDTDLVCYGHSHVAEHHRENGKLVLNPGAIWRGEPPSVALVDLPSMRVETLRL